ncbi:hypothetical protein Fmac_026712 [Flemingia macrophylla]|uniref:CAND6/7 N-terminal domain-containing protein n=1 Tax=Flemingia macrophylla TaxID=520843 RepID=A0ABD1LFL9_9FABA
METLRPGTINEGGSRGSKNENVALAKQDLIVSVYSRHTLCLFTFDVLSPPPSSSFNRTYPVTTPNEYSLFFANCKLNITVSMSLRSELFNLYPTRTEISSAHTHLPSLFFLFSVAYFSFFTFSLSLTKHLLIPSFLLANALNLLSTAAFKHRINLVVTPVANENLYNTINFV